jgi:hypothetical protein
MRSGSTTPLRSVQGKWQKDDAYDEVSVLQQKECVLETRTVVAFVMRARVFWPELQGHDFNIFSLNMVLRAHIDEPNDSGLDRRRNSHGRGTWLAAPWWLWQGGTPTHTHTIEPLDMHDSVQHAPRRGGSESELGLTRLNSLVIVSEMQSQLETRSHTCARHTHTSCAFGQR